MFKAPFDGWRKRVIESVTLGKKIHLAPHTGMMKQVYFGMILDPLLWLHIT